MKYIINQEAFAPLLLSTLPPPVAGPMQGVPDRGYRRLQYRTLLEGLAALKDKRERLEELDQDAEAVLEYRTRMALEALSVLIPEERHQFYKMLRLKIMAFSDSLPEIQLSFLFETIVVYPLKRTRRCFR